MNWGIPMSNDFLTKLKESVKELKSKIRDQRLNPNNFRIFEGFKIDEMTLSSMIQRAVHLIEESSDASFRDLILSKIQTNYIKSSHQSLVRSWTEYQIKDKRRIDLLFEYDDDFAIGIENKPWAWDQKDQLKDYAEGLQETYHEGRWVLVYLCECLPSQYSLGAENKHLNRIVHLTFKEFCQWIRNHGEALRSGEKWLVGAFLTTLANEIEITVIRNNEMSVDVAKLFDKENGIFKDNVSWEVLDRIYQYRNEYLVQKIKDLVEGCVVSGWEITGKKFPWQAEDENGWKEVDTNGLVNCGINFKLNKVDDWVVRIEFNGARFRNAFFGVVTKDYSKDNCPEWLNHEDFSQWKIGSYWARWEWFEPQYSNWNTPDFFDINEKDLIKKIQEILRLIEKVWTERES